MKKKPTPFLSKLLLLVALPALLASCKVGDEDPFVSFRSRDSRLIGTWKMTNMSNRYEIRTFEPGTIPVTTIIEAEFDGYDMRVQTFVNNVLVRDSVFGFSYQLRLKEKGYSSYDYTIIYFGLAGLKYTGEDSWYWLNTDKKKARLYLGNALQFPTTAGLPGQLPPSISLALSTFITDFGVEGLRKEELQLTFNKAVEQPTGAGGFQRILLNSKMTFDSK